MFDRTETNLTLAIVLGLALGIVAVVLFGEAVYPLRFLGDLFVNALTMIAIPLVICSIVVAIGNLGDNRKLGHVHLKTVLYFLATGAVASALSIILALVIQPGSGLSTASAAAPEMVRRFEGYSFCGWLANQVPASVAAAAATIRILPVTIFAVLFGAMILAIGAKGRMIITICDSAADALLRLVKLVLWFAPIGVFGLTAGLLAENGGLSELSNSLSGLGRFALIVLVAVIIHGAVLLTVALKLIGGRSPWEFFNGMVPALLTGFASGSTTAALPITMECAEKRNTVDRRATALVLPLGSAFIVDGTAIYLSAAAICVAQAFGTPLSLGLILGIFFFSVIGSIGTAGFPQAGIIGMSLVLRFAGLPLEGIGLFVAVDWFFERFRGGLNVWSAGVAAAVMATSSEIGLVERRRPKESTAPVYKPWQRRDEMRDRRKSAEPQRRPVPQTTTVRSQTPASKAAPRPIREERRPERSGDRWSQRKPRRGDEYPSTSRREEYKPADVSPRADAREATRDNEPQAPRTPFGRKPAREPYVRPKAGDSEKERVPAMPREVARPAAEVAATAASFEVPKFPERILEELAGSVRESTDSASKEPVSYAAGNGEPAADAETKIFESDLDVSSTAPSFSTEKTGLDERTEPVPEESRDEPINRFSKLDKAVLGRNERPEREESSFSENLGEVAEIESPRESEITAGKELPPAEKTDAAVPETSDQTDDENQTQWGRGKNRRPSR